MKKVAFVGLGSMGIPMVKRFSSMQSIYQIYAWSRSQQSVHKLLSTIENNKQNEIVIGCNTLNEAVGDSDYIMTCLPTSKDVETVIDNCFFEKNTDQNINTNKPKPIWIDFTSGHPKISQSIALKWRNYIDFMDCPVSGGPRGATNGTLSCMVGCNDKLIFEQAYEDIFQYIASNITHVGNVGSGNTIKAINNLLNVSNLLILSEGLKCVKEYGIDINTALKVINSSSGRSLMSEERYPKQIIENNYNHGFYLGLMRKDIDIALDLITNNECKDTIATNVKELIDISVDKFGFHADYTEIGKLYVDVNENGK
eukprot:313429_1